MMRGVMGSAAASDPRQKAAPRSPPDSGGLEEEVPFLAQDLLSVRSEVDGLDDRDGADDTGGHGQLRRGGARDGAVSLWRSGGACHRRPPAEHAVRARLARVCPHFFLQAVCEAPGRGVWQLFPSATSPALLGGGERADAPTRLRRIDDMWMTIPETFGSPVAITSTAAGCEREAREEGRGRARQSFALHRVGLREAQSLPWQKAACSSDNATAFTGTDLTDCWQFWQHQGESADARFGAPESRNINPAPAANSPRTRGPRLSSAQSAEAAPPPQRNAAAPTAA